MSDVKAALELADRVTKSRDPQVIGSYPYASVHLLAKALLALAAANARMEKVVEAAKDWRESKYDRCRSWSPAVIPLDLPLVSAVDTYLNAMDEQGKGDS